MGLSREASQVNLPDPAGPISAVSGAPSSGPDYGQLKSILPLVAGFLLLIATVVVTANFVAVQKKSDAALRHSVDIRNAISQVFSTIQDAETGQRGYLLTGKDSYLGPYEDAVATTEDRIGRIAACIADCLPASPRMQADVAALRRVTHAKLDELRRTIELRRAGDSASALAIVFTGDGQRQMETVRDLVESLRSENDRMMAAQQEKATRAAEWLQSAVGVAIFLVIALAAYALADARSRNRRTARASAALGEANRSLVEAAANRDRLEAQLRQSQKMEAMGQLTGGLAHDFNNMLAIIIGNLNLLKRRLDRGESRVERHIEQALMGADRAATLTHRLLAFARKQPLTPEPVALNRLVAGMSELLERTLGEGVKVETVLAGGLWRTKADANQLESAILNLAVNARDSMPEGGRLTIETGNAHLDDAYAALDPGIVAGQYVMVAVSDTGSGMPADIVAKAFDPFFTTKDVGKGTGLGLSQVYGFVKQSDGHVKIYSEPGRGTSVKIYLPRLVGDHAAAPAPAVTAGRLPEGSARELILVVEDEDGVRRLAVEALRDLNYTVIHADGAAKALRLLDTHPDVSLLFTDVVMPEMTGKQLVDVARQRRPGLPVLYTTGYTRNAIVHNGVVDADVQLLGKPYTLEQLALKVRQAIAA